MSLGQSIWQPMVFNIKLISSDQRTLPHDECISGLSKEIDNCDLGGRTAYANWEYT